MSGTALDFTQPWVIGARIEADEEQLRFGRGYDHNFVLDHAEGEFALAARVVEPSTGRVMEVFTTEPGMQFYTGNFLTGEHPGKSGVPYHFRHGFCLETQHFPDSPNQPAFPNAILRPGETLKSRTVYRFSGSVRPPIHRMSKISPASLMLLLILVGSGLGWWLTQQSASPAADQPEPEDLQKQIVLLEGQVEYLQGQVGALQDENAQLLQKLGTLGMKGTPKMDPPPDDADPPDYVGMGLEMMKFRKLQALPLILYHDGVE